MKLGAQLYSVRNHIQSPEDIRATFAKIRGIGYENVQFSGASTQMAEAIRDAAAEYGLPVVCTHVPYGRLVNETAALIREHRIIGCPVIGLGAMPDEYRGSREGLEKFLAALRRPVAEILDAGLRFAYHNHNFEFAEVAPGVTCFDLMLEACPDWQWIPDCYWMEYAGYCAADCFRRIGAERLTNVHFKDMAADEKRSICACGAGTLDFSALAKVCRELGVCNVLVEQDNAEGQRDRFVAVQASFAHLRPLI